MDIGPAMMASARALIVRLLQSEYNTPHGIILSVDMPYGMDGLTNLSRPAPLRTYYGKNLEIISPTKYKRVTYGPTDIRGCLAMDPRSYSTKEMSTQMYELGQELKRFVKEKFECQHKSSKMFDCELNHCTILVYNCHTHDINCKLSYHCDCEYDHSGEFMKNNSQGENTPVIVYSMGDSRELCFRKRMAIDGGNHRKCWHIVNEPYCKFSLHDNSIFVLHHDDEKPVVRYSGEYLSQFQHGNVFVKEGLLSIGLIFRHVTKSLIYDNVTCMRVLPDNFFNDKREYINKFDATMEKFKNEKRDIQEKFRLQATDKLTTWKWI